MDFDARYGYAVDGDALDGIDQEPHVLRPRTIDDSLGATWTSVGFNDSSWSMGSASIGYETEQFTPAIDVSVNFPSK